MDKTTRRLAGCKEYQQTIHYSDRTGVRAICSDCQPAAHLDAKDNPQDSGEPEVWGKLTGNIDTPEKLETHRIGS